MNRHHALRRSVRPLLAAIPLACMGLSAPAGAAVVISQVYGGGAATSGSPTYKHDYIELRNTGAEAVSLTGLSLQYGSATGTANWSTMSLSGTIPANGFFLVRTNTTGTLGADLPTPDLSATNGLNLSASNGKVALVNGTAALSGACPTANVLDLVGYGSANCAEGTATPALSNILAAFRSDAGCTDTGSNASDFSVAPPAARNSATTATACNGTGGGTGGGTGTPPVDLSIGAIQGSGSTSPYVNQSVRTSGVVTKLTNTGFFMQSLQGDGNDATSDGIFVFTSSAPTVSKGQLVQVTATVTEFATAGSTVTELTGPSITVQGSGYSITPTPVQLPVAGGLERYEGMLVTLAGPLTVDQNYFQARYGQLTLSAGGRLETPTNRHRPGSAQALAMAADNAARRVVLEDGSSLQNVNPTPFTGPTGALRGGDTLASITGVIDYGPSTTTTTGPGDYRIIPLDNASLQYTISHPRPTTVPAVGGNVKLASFNVLNYFTTFTNGATASGQTGQTCVSGQSASASCRGADSLQEFNRQQAKIVAAISAIDADALGLMEIQNNTVAAQNLVSALNARMGAGTYAVAPGAAAGVVGSDAIKTTIIYKPARLTAVGSSVIDTDPVHSRPTVAQTFAAPNGVRFTLAVNHLKSKGSCPSSGDADYNGNFDSGDGQGCWNAKRVAQATQLRNFVAQLQSASGSNDVVLVGDFNAYGMENPITTLTDNGYVDQIGRFNAFGYSYVFDGAAGRLDHAIATGTASAKFSGATHWHINADESLAHDYNLEFKQPACATCAPDPYAATMYRSSDHDPVVLGLNLYNSYITASATVVTGTSGDDMISAGAGRRTLTGGAGRDQFAFTAGYAGGATITDFEPGVDTISLRAVLAGLGIQSSAPIAQGYVTCTASGANALISVDPDAGGAAVPRPMVLVSGRSCAAVLQPANFIF